MAEMAHAFADFAVNVFLIVLIGSTLLFIISGLIVLLKELWDEWKYM